MHQIWMRGCWEFIMLLLFGLWFCFFKYYITKKFSGLNSECLCFNWYWLTRCQM